MIYYKIIPFIIFFFNKESHHIYGLTKFSKGESNLAHFLILGSFLDIYVLKVHAHSDWRNNMLGRSEMEKGDLLVGSRQMYERRQKNILCIIR